MGFDEQLEEFERMSISSKNEPKNRFYEEDYRNTGSSSSLKIVGGKMKICLHSSKKYEG